MEILLSVLIYLRDQLLGQLIALIAFFAFPAFQYISLKSFAKKDGNPELWYLPAYGFRLVIRNLPGKHILSNIKYRTIFRETVPASQGASVATYQETTLVNQDEFFLFPGNDQVIISFRLESRESGQLYFITTDKLGGEKGGNQFLLHDTDRIISDYIANVENILNFDIKIAKQVELRATSLRTIWKAICEENTERKFPLDRIRHVG